ncbi:hypothetical protein [Lysobacter claricitrinus]|uniref:hypothetical protein n=1 Tax=Lysobacter claricitrinus TaxID=3367728 RepID=UPI0037DA7DD5
MGAPSTPPRLDPAEAEAAAERLLAMHRVQQAADSHGASRDRIVSRVIIVAIAALVGASCGAFMGALRGHGVAGAVLVGLVGAMLALITSRPR